jgi:cytochrome c oxidase cbb3-type subunit 4
MDINELRGYITLVTMVTFLAICWWAYRSGNRARFEADAQLPFLDDSDTQTADARDGGANGEEAR